MEMHNGVMDTGNNALWSKCRQRWAYNILQHHHCCLATERKIGFSAFLIKLIQNDTTKFCHKFSPVLATMFTWLEFINHAGDDSFCVLKLAAVILSANKAKTGIWFCPQNRSHLAKLNLTVYMPPIDLYWTHHRKNANQWAQMISEFLFLQLR